MIIINDNLVDRDKKIKKTHDKIDYLKRMMYYTPVHLDRLYYEELLLIEEKNLEKLQNESNSKEIFFSQNDNIIISKDELLKYNGKDGMPAFVAVKGLVYDVTDIPLWKGGTHFAGLEAGQDLTKYYMECHALKKTLEKLQPIGILVK